LKKAAPSKGPGRPVKLTDEIQERICKALRGGNFRGPAAYWAGISPRTFRDWMLAGKENPDGEMGNFRRAVIEAEQAAEIRAVRLIMKHAKGDAKHAEWWLSHRHAERWAEKKNVKMSGEVGVRPLEKLSGERITELLETLEVSDD
jgi:hypothetical protein